MTNVNINSSEKDNLLVILNWMLDPSEEDEKNIRTEIKTKGIQSLFINIMHLDVSDETKAKLNHLKNIIDELDANHSILITDEGGEK